MGYFIWDIKIWQVNFPIYRKAIYKTSHTIFVQSARLSQFPRILHKFSPFVQGKLDKCGAFLRFASQKGAFVIPQNSG
jgi:hypothetical protein